MKTLVLILAGLVLAGCKDLHKPDPWKDAELVRVCSAGAWIFRRADGRMLAKSFGGVMVWRAEIASDISLDAVCSMMVDR